MIYYRGNADDRDIAGGDEAPLKRREERGQCTCGQGTQGSQEGGRYWGRVEQGDGGWVPRMTPSGWIVAVFSVNYETQIPMGSKDTESKVCTRKKRLERVTWESGKMNKAGTS